MTAIAMLKMAIIVAMTPKIVDVLGSLVELRVLRVKGDEADGEKATLGTNILEDFQIKSENYGNKFALVETTLTRERTWEEGYLEMRKPFPLRVLFT